jgi:hypothetical protein
MANDLMSGKPCNCQQAQALDTALGDIAGGMPDITELEAALGGISANGEGDGLSFDIAALEETLDAGEALDFESFAGASVPTLEALIALAEQHPGLKISISF